MIEIKKFQKKASTEICDKLIGYMKDPLMKTRDITRPFYQNLSAITGSGKNGNTCRFFITVKNTITNSTYYFMVIKGESSSLANL